MIIGNKTFESGKEPYVMGILNVTPDSFSDGGQHNTIFLVVDAKREKMVVATALRQKAVNPFIVVYPFPSEQYLSHFLLLSTPSCLYSPLVAVEQKVF